jgi:hypothetical protein
MIAVSAMAEVEYLTGQSPAQHLDILARPVFARLQPLNSAPGRDATGCQRVSTGGASKAPGHLGYWSVLAGGAGVGDCSTRAEGEVSLVDLGERVANPRDDCLPRALARGGWIARERDPSDRRGVAVRAQRDRSGEIVRIYTGMNTSLDKITADDSETELQLLTDFLRNTADAGRTATSELAADSPRGG